MIALLIAGCVTGWSAPRNPQDVLRQLDSAIENRQHYRQVKEQRIAVLREALTNKTNPRERLGLTRDLLKEYLTYQYDSAFHYAYEGVALARRCGDDQEVGEAQFRFSGCLITGGFFAEAAAVLDTIAKHLTPELMAEYYGQRAFLYQDLHSYTQGSSPQLAAEYARLHRHYHKLQSQLQGTLHEDYLEHADSSTATDVARRKRRLGTFPRPSHDAAVEAYIIGSIYKNIGLVDSAITYTAISALNDIETATRETAAMRQLAQLMHHSGRTDEALRYINLAQEDALFYNSRIRQLEVSTLQPILESERYEVASSQRRLWTALALIALMALAVSVGLLLYVRRSHRRLANAREAEAQANTQARHQQRLTAEANEHLEQANRQLAEANDIKYRYIVESLYSDSHFVDIVDEKTRAISLKLKTRQYSDIPALLREMRIGQERRRMSAFFDRVFLELFPSFIDEYNALLPAEHHITFDEEGCMPAEARIFALMRLGITDTRLIGSYLNLSQNSIYVYRARVKAWAVVDKKDFDARIMAIGLGPTKKA